MAQCCLTRRQGSSSFVPMKKTSFTNPERSPIRDERALSGVGKALAALEFLGSERREVPLAEIARALGMSKAGTHRVLSTLSERGYVDWCQGGRYRLGIRTWELGCQVAALDIVSVAAPLMQELVARTGESAQLGRRSGFDVVYLHSVLPLQP